jgi:hypothetical protein
MPTNRKSTMIADKKCGAPSTKDFGYPGVTTGSETVAKARKEANGWSESKRDRLFERGMQVIYGGSGSNEKIRSRH